MSGLSGSEIYTFDARRLPDIDGRIKSNFDGQICIGFAYVNDELRAVCIDIFNTENTDKLQKKHRELLIMQHETKSPLLEMEKHHQLRSA